MLSRERQELNTRLTRHGASFSDGRAPSICSVVRLPSILCTELHAVYSQQTRMSLWKTGDVPPSERAPHLSSNLEGQIFLPARASTTHRPMIPCLKSNNVRHCLEGDIK